MKVNQVTTSDRAAITAGRCKHDKTAGRIRATSLQARP